MYPMLGSHQTMSIEAKLLTAIKTMAKSSIDSSSIICPLLITSTEVREAPAQINRQLLLSPVLELPLLQDHAAQPLTILYSLDLSIFIKACISSRTALRRILVDSLHLQDLCAWRTQSPCPFWKTLMA